MKSMYVRGYYLKNKLCGFSTQFVEYVVPDMLPYSKEQVSILIEQDKNFGGWFSNWTLLTEEYETKI